MATIKHFEDLEVWKVSRELCADIGKLIDKGAFKNNFRIIGQIEGSSGSIMDNISEGFERGTRAEFIQFLVYAKGSCGELRSQLHRALDRNYINGGEHEKYNSFCMRISAMLQKLITYLQSTKVMGERKKTIKPLNP